MRWLMLVAVVTLAGCSPGGDEAALASRITALEQELETLPRPLSGPAGGTLGYASEVEREDPRQALKWVGVDLGRPMRVDAVALAPGWMILTDRSERTHGFPLEFRVELADDADFRDARVVFESGPDYPDPGRHPVWIDVDPQQAQFARVVATALSPNFLGLSELFVFSGGSNAALGKRVVALDELNVNVNWRKRFLTDGYVPFGLPTAAKNSAQAKDPGLRGGYRSGPLPEATTPSWIVVEMDAPHSLTALTLMPAFFIPNLTDFSQMGQGFPTGFRIELAEHGGPWRTVFEHNAETSYPFPSPGNLAWSLPIADITASKLRLTATQHRFDVNTQSFRLGFSELMLLDEDGQNVALHAQVSVSHPPLDDPGWPAKKLVDGLSSEGAILPLRDWLQSLDRRRRVLQERDESSARLAALTLRREQWTTRLIWAAAGIAALSVAGFALHLRRSRQLHAAALREQIAQDLHDEVGSTLGSISLFSSALARRETLDDAGRQRLDQVADMAREASRTMRDLVWVVDQRSDDSGHLIEHLRETAAQLLGDHPFTFDAPTRERPFHVSPEQKRHLLLFVKEALHNALRHASARHITLRIRTDESRWKIEVSDDGKGFTVEPENHPQLEKLRARARRLLGSLDVTSAPGAGTRLLLDVPQSLPKA